MLKYLVVQVLEQVEEGGQDVALPLAQQVAEAALARLLRAGRRQRQRLLQPQEHAPANWALEPL